MTDDAPRPLCAAGLVGVGCHRRHRIRARGAVRALRGGRPHRGVHLGACTPGETMTKEMSSVMKPTKTALAFIVTLIIAAPVSAVNCVSSRASAARRPSVRLDL